MMTSDDADTDTVGRPLWPTVAGAMTWQEIQQKREKEQYAKERTERLEWDAAWDGVQGAIDILSAQARKRQDDVMLSNGFRRNLGTLRELLLEVENRLRDWEDHL
jgi:hypothetical protein